MSLRGRWLFLLLGWGAVLGEQDVRANDAPAPGFLENRGQVAPAVRYYATNAEGAVFFEPRAVTIDHAPDAPGQSGVAVRIDFPGVRSPRLVALHPQASKTHVLRGTDRGRWRTGLTTYSEVRYGGIAPGADLVYRVDGGRLKYDVVLGAGADLSTVRLHYEGVERLELAADGGLILRTQAGALREDRPYLYQDVNGRRREVKGGYRILPGNELGFWASDYDRELPLVVDPGVQWSTFLGGSSADNVYGMTTDGSGNIYVVGATGSSDFPTTPGAYQGVFQSTNDVVVTKLSSDGATAMWSTYLAGSGNDDGRAIAVDASGNVYVAGNTGSTNFPVTPGAHRTTHAGGLSDGFVAKISSTGSSLVYCTFVGGNWDDNPRALAVDGSGNAIIAGSTNSLDYPVTSGVVKPVRNPSIVDGADGFLTKVNSNGSGLVWSTFFGSDGGTDNIFALALDSSGRPTVVGWTLSPTFPVTATAYDRTYAYRREGFITRLTSTVNGYVYSTFLGGDGHDECLGVALDGSGAAYVSGRTESTNFPTTSGAPGTGYAGGTYDAFAVKLGPNGDVLGYGTYLGGSGTDEGRGVTVTTQGVVTVTGNTNSNNYPTSSSAYDVSANGGTDAFVTCLSATGGLSYSSYLGGSGADAGQCAAMKPNGHAVIGGQTASSTFPTTSGAYDRSHGGNSANDDFVTVFDLGSGTVGVEPGPSGLVYLAPVQPNPFSGSVSIDFTLEIPGSVTLSIRDLQGRIVRRLEDGERSAGAQSVTWDGRSDDGSEVPAGIYFVQLGTESRTAVQRIVRVR